MTTLPDWMVLGAGIGILSSICVAALFLLAEQLFPAPSSHEGRADVESRREAEIGEYLDAIGEQYAEGHPVAGQPVAFYLPERDVAITFDARAYFRIEKTPTTPILVEHEMPGVALGGRLPFETPDVASGEPGNREVDPGLAAFRELGLSAGATVEEVKSAYRRRVKDVHPDQGGSEAEFKRVREAYTTAKQHAS